MPRSGILQRLERLPRNCKRLPSSELPRCLQYAWVPSHGADQEFQRTPSQSHWWDRCLQIPLHRPCGKLAVPLGNAQVPKVTKSSAISLRELETIVAARREYSRNRYVIKRKHLEKLILFNTNIDS